MRETTLSIADWKRRTDAQECAHEMHDRCLGRRVRKNPYKIVVERPVHIGLKSASIR